MSNTLDLTQVDRICGALAGVKKVSLTSMSNINRYTALPEIIDPTQVYAFYFRESTGGYTEKSGKTAAGSYMDQQLTFFTPKKRFDVFYIVQQLLDNRCAVIHESWDGDTDILLNASMTYQYTTGTKRTDRNGTEFLFKAKTRRKEQFAISGLSSNLQPDDTSVNLPDGGTIGGNGSGPFDGTGNNEYPAFFVEIIPAQTSYTPTPTGNTQYLNKFITAADGSNYFIDHQGNALRFSSFPTYYELFTPAQFTGNTVTVTVGTLPTDPKDLWVFVNGRKLEEAAAVDQDSYTRSGQTLTFFRLTSKSQVVLYF